MKTLSIYLIILIGTISISWANNIDLKIAALKPTVDACFAQLNLKKNLNKENVKYQLKLMYDLDQTIRKECIHERENPKIKSFIDHIDKINIRYVKKIIEKYGWIKISEFGKDASNQAWLLVQHADFDPNYQYECLKIMEKLLPTKEIDPQNYAYLYDRVALKTPAMGMRQKYGTQIQKKGENWELLPFEGTLEDVNRLRSDIGLDAVEDYLKFAEKMYGI